VKEEQNTMNKITLYGFNNLTKNLSFSLYKLHYIHQHEHLARYSDYINTHYNSKKLTTLLSDICHAIGGNVLNIANQDYQPHGASVTLMMSEEAQPEPLPSSIVNSALPQSLVAHLDKSHLCIHTYPDEILANKAESSLQANNSQSANKGKVAIFRADIELSTCGVISPLKVLDYVINAFNADVIDVDYRIRGMTRNLQGAMQFNDQDINQISDFLSPQLLSHYQVEDNSLIYKNLFHSRLCRKENSAINNIFAHQELDKLSSKEKENISTYLQDEMQQIFSNSTS